jgi:hypothetical protein
MAFAMNRHLIEREWIVPKLCEFIKAESQLDLQDNIINYVQALFGKFSLQVKGGKAEEFFYDFLQPNAAAWTSVSRLYESHFDGLNRWLRSQRAGDSRILQEELKALRQKGDPRVLDLESQGPRVAQTEQVAVGRRKSTSKVPVYRIALDASDDVWVKKTRVPEYFRRYANAMKSLLGQVQADDKSQRDILGALLGS